MGYRVWKSRNGVHVRVRTHAIGPDFSLLHFYWMCARAISENHNGCFNQNCDVVIYL